MNDEKYWLVEYVQTLESGKTRQIRKECKTLEEALDLFNMDLEGNYLGHPELGSHPEGYIIKGIKINIKIKKIGMISK